MLSLALALAAVLAVVASLASRLSEVHAASNKLVVKGSPAPVNTGNKTSTRSTASGKHFPKTILRVR
ncbi:MAG: hypothetical protein ACJ8F0_13905 [Xanthobacteraceae bacterium]|jgi:hypothetical protein